MQNIHKIHSLQPEAVGAAVAGFVRAVATTLVVTVPLVVTPWGEAAYSYIKSELTIALALIGLLGWMVVFVTTRHPKWQGTLPELALWAFLLAGLLSTATSVDPSVSLFGGLGRHEGLLTICAYAAWYFIGVHFLGSQRRYQSLVVAAGIAATVAIGYGILQVFAPPLFEGEAFVREWYGRLGIPRVGSTLGGPLVFGGYLAFILPMVCAVAAVTRSRVRVVWLAVAFLAVIDVALTLTRASWLALLAGMGIFVAAATGMTSRTRRIVIGGSAVAVLAAALILMAVVSTPSQVRSRVTASVDTSAGSVAQHIYIWRHVVQLIQTRPLLGWGLDTLGAVFPYDRESLVRYFGLRPVTVDRAHNDVLQVAVSVGIPGAMAYVGFWVLVLMAGVRVWRRHAGPPRLFAAAWLGGLAAYLLQAQFSFSTVAITPLVWLMAGAVCAWESAPADIDHLDSHDRDDPEHHG
ncbi:MAG TPA: O-antigen ligase family protein [bacterium]|nr:O-antigen ligase family protein [bacterium]